MKLPSLSIGLPVFNGQAFIDDAIRSVIEQTYTNFELVVCDNASTDGTVGIVEKWCAADSRVTLHRAPHNRGAAENFNWAFSLSSAPFFKWCAVDDLLEPECLQMCVDALERAPDAVLAYSGAVDIDETGRYLGEIYDNREAYAFGSAQPAARFRDLVCHGHSCISVFGVIRREALIKTSLIGPYAASDKVLLAELGVQGRFVRVHDRLIRHRQHSKRSVTENPTLRQRLPWFNPNHRGLAFPYFRLFREYARTALRNDLPVGDRLQCFVHVLRWVSWEGWRGLLDDLAYYIRPRRERPSVRKAA